MKENNKKIFLFMSVLFSPPMLFQILKVIKETEEPDLVKCSVISNIYIYIYIYKYTLTFYLMCLEMSISHRA